MLSRTDSYSDRLLTNYALKLSLLFFVRSSELCFARWREIDWQQKLWIIPEMREPIKNVRFFRRGAKMKTQHIVPSVSSNVKGFGWNHKRVYRIYCELSLNMRIKPKKRLKREEPEPLKVPTKRNKSWSIDFMHDQLSDGRSVRYDWPGQNLFSSLEELQQYAKEWQWFYNHERPNMTLGGYTPKQYVLRAA